MISADCAGFQFPQVRGLSFRRLRTLALRVLFSLGLFLSVSGFVLGGGEGVLAQDLFLSPLESLDHQLKDWSISGANTVRGETYAVGGNGAASPFPFEGSQGFSEFSLQASNRRNPYATWQGQVFGVLNASDYRSRERGLVFERLSLTRQQGDVALPYRAMVGDIFPLFSFRTLQSSLKGAQVEVQPKVGPNAARHSFQFVSGTRQASWQNVDVDEDYTNGLFWLMEDQQWGRWGLQWVHNTRAANASAGTLNRNQQVVGLAWEQQLPLGQDQVTIEAEGNYFTGDHGGTTGAASGQDRQGHGLFMQISGQGKSPLNYRIRYEDYSQDYQPAGAVVTPGLRSEEGHVGWRFPTGLQARGRFQHFRNNRGLANPLDTYTGGLGLSGPFLTSLVENLTIRADGFIQEQETKDLTTDTTTTSLSVGLTKPLLPRITGNADFFYQFLNPHGVGSTNTTTWQGQTGVVYAFAHQDISGTVGPQLLSRRVLNPASDSQDWQPSVNMNLIYGPHTLNFSERVLFQDRMSPGGLSVTTMTTNVNYRVQYEAHTLGVEMDWITRDPTSGGDTESFRFGVFWRIEFDKPAAAPVLAPRASGPGEVPSTGLDLFTTLRLGSPLADVRDRLSQQGFVVSQDRPGLLIYEVQLLPLIPQRQRLVLVHDRVLQRTVLIIDFDPDQSTTDILRTFDRVRQLVLTQFGTPRTFFEEGEFGNDPLGELRGGDVRRALEWDHPDGLLRFGIPQRVDGQVRMELTVAPKLQTIRDPLWSVQEVQ